MKKKPFIQVLLSVLLVAVILVGGTMAYLFATDSPLINTFKLAHVDTEIEENPQEGTEANKEPYVTNTGSSPVYIRAKAVVVTQEGSPVAVSNDQVKFEYNTSTWTENPDEDGYYYYKQILQPRKSAVEEFPKTDALFTGLTVDPTVSEDALFSVVVYHESVLAPSGENVKWDFEQAKQAFQKAESSETAAQS